ncbi:type IX secretion system ring subunit PorN/GldN [Parapedobacter koreensis]|uniref:Gliding motility associated protien GldN n=1 Tax=Parapedobacter koreensis TaxID=332977 RepID=A0A1H7SSH8_9SPHI|nr:gliding motility protein GldN [Parapedobacter koreensis]SEL74874.1 gliding motility associated protien GldN [Parapedobacter koreensis]
MKVYVFLVSMFIVLTTSAQQGNLSNSTTPITAEEPPVDGYYVKSDILGREVIPYPIIRPTDVAYVKRIWREFDIREKMNSLYASPKSRLIDVIMEAVLAGELTAYDPTPTEDDPTGDSFKTRLAPDQVLGRFGTDSTLVEEFDENGNVVASHFEAATFNPEDIVRFRIKEDWIFDKQRSVFEPRIIGIAPLITPKIDEIMGGATDDIGAGAPADVPSMGAADNPSIAADAYPAFWIYFPEARHVFINKEVTSRQNDATGLSYDDVFIKRLFASYIVKQSNPEDLRIRDYIDNGLNRLYEAERIKKGLVDFEQDLWSY